MPGLTDLPVCPFCGKPPVSTVIEGEREEKVRCNGTYVFDEARKPCPISRAGDFSLYEWLLVNKSFEEKQGVKHVEYRY